MNCQHFKDNYSNCTACARNPINNAQENKSKYSLLNPQRREVCKIQLDGCVLNDSSLLKCDYLFLSCETSAAFFVELKGSDILHAIDQIEKSIEQIGKDIAATRINARIVLSKAQTPDMRTPKYLKFKKKIHGLGGTFEHKNLVFVESLVD